MYPLIDLRHPTFLLLQYLSCVFRVWCFLLCLCELIILLLKLHFSVVFVSIRYVTLFDRRWIKFFIIIDLIYFLKIFSYTLFTQFSWVHERNYRVMILTLLCLIVPRRRFHCTFKHFVRYKNVHLFSFLFSFTWYISLIMMTQFMCLLMFFRLVPSYLNFYSLMLFFCFF